jgi:hypothetical protein
MRSSFLLDGSNVLAIAIMEATIMESIRVRQHVGQDGILHLDIPVGLTERDVEVMVIYQPIQPLAASERSLADFYGICADDPITLDEQGISEALDDELAGTFD